MIFSLYNTTLHSTAFFSCPLETKIALSKARARKKSCAPGTGKAECIEYINARCRVKQEKTKAVDGTLELIRRGPRRCTNI